MYAIVTSATQFIYKDRVHKEDEESDRPEVHYEDIGGLGRELSQVREMIEYPLRHPEVFEKLGINIHNPLFGAWVDSTHQNWSKAYNQAWEAFFKAVENPTVKQIFEKAAELAEQFGFNIHFK